MTNVMDSSPITDSRVSGTYNVKLSDSGIRLIESMFVDASGDNSVSNLLGSMKDIAVTYDMSTKGDLAGGTLKLKLSSSDIVTLNYVIDNANGKIYAQIPEINDRYICIDADTLCSLLSGFSYGDSYDYDDYYYDDEYYDDEYYDDEYYNDESYDSDDLYGFISDDDDYYYDDSIDYGGASVYGSASVFSGLAMLDFEKLEKMLGSYIEAAVENVEDVSKSTETVTADGVSQNCTALKMSFSKKSAAKIAKAILTKARDDKELKDFIVDYADKIGMSNELNYDDFVAEIDLALESLDDYDLSTDPVLYYTVWVDGKGEIIGREVEYEGVVISYKATKDGKKMGIAFSAVEKSSDTELFGLSGSGKSVSGKFTGELRLTSTGFELIDIGVTDFDTKSAEKGYVNGEFVVSAGSGLGAYTNHASVGLMLSNFKIKFAFNGSKTDSSAGVYLLMSEDEVISVNMNAAISNAQSITVPDNAVDASDEAAFEEWLGSSDWKIIINNLKEAGFPSEMLMAETN